MIRITLIVSQQHDGHRLDNFIASTQDVFTRSSLEKLFVKGRVKVNGSAGAKSYKVKTGDKIEIDYTDSSEKSKPQPLKSQIAELDIIYEDDDILVVNKEKGVVVHPCAADETDTLVNMLLYHTSGKLADVGDGLRPGIVHRIDKDTSGLLVVAKTSIAYENLSVQVENHTMLRRYRGVVYGKLSDDCGEIDAPIGRHPVHRTKNCVINSGRHAVTKYRVIERFKGFTHLEFELKTGRMHQIRVHMAHVGHPFAGDLVYGPAKQIKFLKGQCLHAGTLGFAHPKTGEFMEFYSDPPENFTSFLKKLEDIS